MTKYQITDVLPHQYPMMLIDSLHAYDDESCTCQVTITTNSPFYNAETQGVPTYIGSEYMAQSIAAYAGAQALDDNQEVSIGFLLGSRKFHALQPEFPLNETFTIHIKELYREDSGLRVFECNIKNTSNDMFAKANINVFQPKDPKAFIAESNQ